MGVHYGLHMATPKTQIQALGRISVDLHGDKTRLVRLAKKNTVSAHRLARDLIIEGLNQMEDGKLKFNPPSEGGFE